MTKKAKQATQVQMLSMSSIMPNEGQLEGLPANPREIRDEKFQKLKANIEKYPELLEYRSLMVYPMANDSYIIIGGNMRYHALMELGYTEAPCIVIDPSTPVDRLGAYTILDNNGFGKWDWDLLANEWTDFDLDGMGLDMEFSLFEEEEKEKSDNTEKKRKLSDVFVVPPFSILDSRQGYWQERKRAWKEKLGGVEGESREDTLKTSDSLKYPSIYTKSKAKRKELGISFKEYLDKYVSKEEKEKAEKIAYSCGVSLFDPVLAEILCKWFTPSEGAQMFDCFAGDTRKGLVFAYCGRKFKGIELRREQVDINNNQIKNLGLDIEYICDDGCNVAKHFAKESQDMLFSCPPYYDLEVYSDLENDASNQGTYEDFIEIMDKAFGNAIECLKNNRFAVIVVGDVRNKIDGAYYGFHDDIVRIFRKHGMVLYNELIYVECIGAAALRTAKQMETRKICKTHQNVLVFYKGNARDIKQHFPKMEYNEEELSTFIDTQN
jgi:DNA modification methylase